MGQHNLIKTQTLGARLKALREERNLSQRELARLSGLSPNSISLIERNEISPTVATLQSLAAALNVKVGSFFDEKVQNRVILSKAGERHYIRSSGTKIEGLGERLNRQEVEPFLISLEPHSSSGEREVSHAGHEIVYCVQGKIEYRIDNERYLIEAGDFLLFEAHLPHLWFNPGEEPAQFLLIIETSPDSTTSFEEHFSNLSAYN